jgi:serine/threonine protein kinase/formylglycine-generating enzyme required for sulfatase activity
MAHSEPLSSPAYDVFAGYLRELQAGKPADFDALCARHPPAASHLRELHRRWSELLARKEQADLSPDDLERRLREWSESLDADGSPGRTDDPEAHLRAVVERLANPESGRIRLEERGEVARGAMGRVLRVWDRELRRSLAKKVLLERPVEGPQGQRESAQRLGRFLEEAQITAQLDHPGIVPVHDLGVDAAGQVYFTMKLVRGEDLKSVFEKVRRRADGWTLTRALGVIARLCEAMAFAHSKNVVHRDLKPANVMVGRFGEVYVMDWGLARVLDRPETRDLRLQEGSPPPSVELTTERTDDYGSDRSPLRTMDGHVVGTPAYMPPEQARGQVEQLGPRSDVYAVGAMLYHLLAGRMPYVEEGRPVSPYEVWSLVRERPPRPIRELARQQPAELVAICEKAMSRDPAARYADMRELAGDLSNFLEHRVVRAYRTGPWVELSKWVDRNRAVAASIATLVVLAVVAGLAVFVLERRRSSEALRAADEHAVVALVSRAQSLWPVHPTRVLDMELWVADAQEVLQRLPRYEAIHAALEREAERQAVGEAERGTATQRARVADLAATVTVLKDLCSRAQERIENPQSSAERRNEDRRILGVYALELERLDEELADAQRSLGPAERRRLAHPGMQAAHARSTRLLAGLHDLARPGSGWLARIERRARDARELERRSLHEAEAAWAAAIEDIADGSRSPAYRGLRLTPQLGLVPLRRDPQSGLWEFWHVLSGERPSFGPTSGYELTAQSGLVLVLVPGGKVVIGSDPSPDVPADEVPRRELELAPYFLSKYELTQGQWYRLTGQVRGNQWAGAFPGQDHIVDRTHPVQNLSLEDCSELLSRWNLLVPSEAQWQAAALAGETIDGGWASSREELDLIANLLGDTYEPGSAVPAVREPWSEDRGDAYTAHSPVGYFPANPWGFHEIVGNVNEWCRDRYVACGYRDLLPDGNAVSIPADPETGELLLVGSSAGVLRGGDWASARATFRLAARQSLPIDQRHPRGGVRPSRQIAFPTQP